MALATPCLRKVRARLCGTLTSRSSKFKNSCKQSGKMCSKSSTSRSSPKSKGWKKNLRIRCSNIKTVWRNWMILWRNRMNNSWRTSLSLSRLRTTFSKQEKVWIKKNTPLSSFSVDVTNCCQVYSLFQVEWSKILCKQWINKIAKNKSPISQPYSNSNSTLKRDLRKIQ